MRFKDIRYRRGQTRWAHSPSHGKMRPNGIITKHQEISKQQALTATHVPSCALCHQVIWAPSWPLPYVTLLWVAQLGAAMTVHQWTDNKQNLVQVSSWAPRSPWVVLQWFILTPSCSDSPVSPSQEQPEVPQPVSLGVAALPALTVCRLESLLTSQHAGSGCFSLETVLSIVQILKVTRYDLFI